MLNHWLRRTTPRRSSHNRTAADNQDMNSQTGASRRSLLEPLERRELLSTSTVHANAAKIKVKNLFDSSGVSTNQSLVTVPFTGNISIFHASGIQVRGYIKDPITGAQRKVVVDQVESPRVGGDGKSLIIHTGVLMRKNGGKILISSDALRDAKKNFLASQTVSSPKGQNKERFTLANRGFRATDHNLFNTTVFSDASAPIDTSTAIPDATVTTNLTDFLNAKVSAGLITPAQRTSALSRYNSSTAQGIIANANLRAALVSLVGTIGEPAIAAMLDGKNSTGKPWTVIAFSTEVSPTAEIAETVKNSTTGRLRTLFKTQYMGEPFQVLGAKLAHEALHQDFDDGVKEELFTNNVETMVYAQQMLGDKTVATFGSEVVKLDNSKLYAMLESGRALFPRVGTQNGPLLTSGVFPGGATPGDGHGPYLSFEDFIRRTYEARGFSDFASAGNGVLNSDYANITGDTTTAVTFNDTLMKLVDSKQQVITDKSAITLAGDLKLTV